MLDKHTLFIADTYVNEDPTPRRWPRSRVMAAEEVRRFGLPPKVAFLSHSTFGASTSASARKMRRARDLFARAPPDVEATARCRATPRCREDVRQQLPARQHADAARPTC